MNAVPVRIGIDDRGRYFYVARVRHDTGRPQVEALARFERSLVRSHPILQSGELRFAVADDLVTTSELSVAGGGPSGLESMIRFEQTQSLLDDQVNFSFDALPLESNDGRFLGMTVRRSHLSDLVQPFTASIGGDLTKAQFALRSEALGRGYLSFGRGARGEFICLIDIDQARLSICFLHRKNIVGVAHQTVNSFDLSSASDFERLAIELKTVVNFKLAAFSECGINVPLSCMILSGMQLDEQVIGILKRYFSVPVLQVGIQSGFFPQPERMAEIPVGEYLVALGLTALTPERFSG